MSQVDPLILTLREWVNVFIHRSMQNFILYAKESGLSISQIGALFQILHKGSSDVTGLGDELGVTSAAASQLLERMVQQRLILRTEDPNDRRVKVIVLSDKGRQVVQESMEARQNWMEGLVDSLSPAEKEQVKKALVILIEKAKQYSL